MLQLISGLYNVHDDLSNSLRLPDTSLDIACEIQLMKFLIAEAGLAQYPAAIDASLGSGLLLL